MKAFILISFLFCNACLYSQSQSDTLDLYMDNYRYNEALAYIENHPPTKEFFFKKALCFKNLEDYSEAIRLLGLLSEEFPEDRRIRMELASCYQAVSNWKASLDCYDALIGLDTVNVYYQVQRASMLFRLNDYKGALSAYKDLVAKHGLNSMIKRVAQCYENLNMPDDAIKHYKQAWEADSTDAFSAASLVNLSLKLERPGDAIYFSETYMKRDSTNRQINLLNALSYYACNRYDEAAYLLERCHSAGDSSLVVNRSLGISHYYMGNNLLAEPYLLKAYEQDSTNNNVLYCLAVISNETANYRDAISYFNTLLRRTIPSDMTLYSYYKGLALGYTGVNDYKLATENYLLAEPYATKSQKMILYYTLADLYEYRMGKEGLAVDCYKKYKVLMGEYLEHLKTMPQNDKIAAEITEQEFKIKRLSAHIEQLEKRLSK